MLNGVDSSYKPPQFERPPVLGVTDEGSTSPDRFHIRIYPTCLARPRCLKTEFARFWGGWYGSVAAPVLEQDLDDAVEQGEHTTVGEARKSLGIFEFVGALVRLARLCHPEAVGQGGLGAAWRSFHTECLHSREVSLTSMVCGSPDH